MLFFWYRNQFFFHVQNVVIAQQVLVNMYTYIIDFIS